MEVEVLTAGGSNGIAIQSMVINRLRCDARIESPHGSPGMRGLTPKLDLSPIIAPNRSPFSKLTPKLTPKDGGSLEDLNRAHSAPDLEKGSGSQTDRSGSGKIHSSGRMPGLPYDTNKSGATTARESPNTARRNEENFELQKHLAQRLLWAADLPSAQQEMAMGDMHLEGLEGNEDGRITARAHKPLSGDGPPLLKRERAESTEHKANIVSSSDMRSSGKSGGGLESILSPKSQVRTSTELEEVDVMLDKMEFLLTLRMGYDGKPLLDLRKAADLLVHQLQASIDVNRRTLAKEPDVVSPKEQERMLNMIGDMRGLLDDYRDAAESLSRKELIAKILEIDNLGTEMQREVDTNDPVFRRWRMPTKVDKEDIPEDVVLPYSLIFAVVIDAFIDGFLSGIAYSADPKTGFVIAGATCIENGFLGLTFSATISNATKSSMVHAMIVVMPPIVMSMAGCLAGAIGPALESSTFTFIIFLSFAVVALLWIVTQELLLQAHENAANTSVWYINMWLFVGVMMSLMAGAMIPA